jgi:hypothetical protein
MKAREKSGTQTCIQRIATAAALSSSFRFVEPETRLSRQAGLHCFASGDHRQPFRFGAPPIMLPVLLVLVLRHDGRMELSRAWKAPCSQSLCACRGVSTKGSTYLNT